MHVRLPADRGRVSQFGRHEAHRESDVPLRFSRRTSGTDLRKHGGGAQRPAPRTKVLGAVARAEPFVEIVVDIARRQVAPAAPAALESKEACSGCTELPLHE